MTFLLHLNGPPGIGKSTISALYTDRHPGTLNLDIDSLHRLIGGWRDPRNDTHRVLRPVALAMAATHLHGGRSVVLPQYLARPDAIDAFEEVARKSGADFFEFILFASKQESIARFDRRQEPTPWNEHNRHVVALQGGEAFLVSMYDELLDIARQRPSARIIRSEADAIEKTYELLIEALPGHG